MKTLALSLSLALGLAACGAPGDLTAAKTTAARTDELKADPAVVAPACTDILFVTACLPADCYDRAHTATTKSLSRHALCPTLNNCKSYVDVVGKTRTCDETGCTNHALGFLHCYKPDLGNDDPEGDD